MGRFWGALRPGSKTISGPATAGVLFVRGFPGAAPRARTRNTASLLPEVLARLCPARVANFAPKDDTPEEVERARRLAVEHVQLFEGKQGRTFRRAQV